MRGGDVKIKHGWIIFIAKFTILKLSILCVQNMPNLFPKLTHQFNLCKIFSPMQIVVENYANGMVISFLPFLVIRIWRNLKANSVDTYKSLEIREMTLFGNETQQSSKFKQSYFVGVCLFPSLLRLIKTDSGRRKWAGSAGMTDRQGTICSAKIRSQTIIFVFISAYQAGAYHPKILHWHKQTIIFFALVEKCPTYNFSWNYERDNIIRAGVKLMSTFQLHST